MHQNQPHHQHPHHQPQPHHQHHQPQQQTQTCAICEQQPQDLLVLICGHNLCVNCASQIYHINGQSNPFICQICLVETQLDQQTIQHFRSQTDRTYHNNNNKKKQLIKIQQSPNKNTSSNNNNNKPPKSRSPQKCKQTRQKLPHNKKLHFSYTCKIHNEPALYYCYNCNTSDICSQCILTPKHNTHKVLTLKKAYINFQKKLQQQLKSYQQIKNALNQQKHHLTVKKQQLLKNYSHKKQQLKQIFDEIARLVSEKYVEYCTKIQEECTKQQKIYQAYISELGEKEKIVQETIRVCQRYHVSDQNALIEYMTSTMMLDTKTLFSPNSYANTNIYKQLPHCSLQFQPKNKDIICYQITSLLSKFLLIKDTHPNNNRHQYSDQQQDNLTEYSYIRQQPQDHHYQQPIRTALKQTYNKNQSKMADGMNMNMNRVQRTSINSNNGNNGNTGNKLANSRKLDLNRSLQNATYIINRLQQRSKNV